MIVLLVHKIKMQDKDRFNLFWSGMKAMAAPRYRAEICRARNKFSLSRFTKRCISMIFSFYRLQIVLLTTVNNKIY